MYILNKKSEILELLLKKINNADKIWISIAFITFSGWKILLKNSQLANKKIKVITTTDNFITSSRVLKYLLRHNIPTKIINQSPSQRDYHAKFIIFKNKRGFEIMNGSLNLTRQAFFHKYELVSFDQNQEALALFNFLWNQGQKLNSEIVNKYQKEHIAYWSKIAINQKNLNFLPNYPLNPMQKQALHDLQIIRKQQHNRALLWSATGTGKTYLSAHDAKNFKFRKLLFIVHNRLIIQNAILNYRLVFPKANLLELFNTNLKQVEQSNIIFSTQITLNKIINKQKTFLEQFDYFVFDEAHKIGPENLQGKILNIIKNKSKIFILAMTATPNRSDYPEFLFANFPSIVGKIDLQKAIEQKLICNFKYFGLDVNIDFNQNHLSNLQLELMIDKLLTKLQEINTWDKQKIKGLIFTKNIKEANQVASILSNKKILAYPIHSQNSSLTNEVAGYLENLSDNKHPLNFLVTVNKFNEGIDIPNLNTIVMLRFTESSIIYLQQIGRGLRKIINQNKYLNIIDLVGNHQQNFNRIASLKGKTIISPEQIVKTFYDWNNNHNFINTNFEISEIAIAKIFASLIKVNKQYLSFLHFFKNVIVEQDHLYQEQISLLNLEKIFKNPIQIIANNFRSSKTHRYGQKSWLVNCLGLINLKWNNILPWEQQIIELFAWLPLSVSSIKEKKIIVDLLNGKEVELTSRWVTYFLGKNVFNHNMSQIIHGDFSKYFTYQPEKKTLRFKNLLKTNEAKQLLMMIKKYLQKNSWRNDYLKLGNWYSKVEIGFMAGYSANVVKTKFAKYQKAEDLENDLWFWTNIISPKKHIPYENKVIDSQTFIICNDTDAKIKNPKNLHLFLGSDFGHQLVLYKYLGKPSRLESYDLKKYKQWQRRYLISTSLVLNAQELAYWKFIQYLKNN